TDAVERVVVRLDDTTKTNAIRDQIQSLLPEHLVAKTWTELATFYQQVVDYYKVQNLMVEVVIMLLVLLSIANTVGMAISERTGEIGTVRALGDTRRDLVFQFMMEGLILGLMGGALGCLLGLTVTTTINSMQIMVQVPGASAPVAIEIAPLFTSFRDGILLTSAMAVVASVVPAVRASRMKIVEALKRNI
ncbi:MAG: FtsX-like permease family protein, partial [Proteobacteria bacterium]|nr:FtsX-like permease family protein [Pseudomonadota bacterium]